MKRKFLPTLSAAIALLFSVSVNGQMVPNGDFEQVVGGQVPGWVSLGGGNIQIASEIQVNTPNGQVTIPSNGGENFIVLRNTQTIAAIRTVKHAITTTPKSLRFQCMYFPGSSSDGFAIQIVMTKEATLDSNNNTVIDTVLNASARPTGQRFPWQTFMLSIPDDLYKGSPDSVTVAFITGTAQGSSLMLDDVIFVDYSASTGAVSLLSGDIEVFPNPVSSTAALSYTLNMESNVKVDIYDVQGRLVSSVLDEVQHNGTHTQQVDVSSLSSGIYFFRITTGEKAETVKFVKQ